MKKLFFLAATVLSVALFTGCDGSGSGGITVNPGTLNFTAAGGTDFVTVTGSDWTVTSNNPGWMTAVKQGNSVAVTVGAATEARLGSITISSSSDSKNVIIAQAAPAGGGDTTLFKFEVNGGDYATYEEFTADLSAKFTLIDKDGDGYNWRAVYYVDDNNQPTGEYALMSDSYLNYPGIALSPENYLLLPAVTISADGKVKATLIATDADWCEETFKVIISNSPITIGNCQSATALLTHTFEDGELYTVDINVPASYNGSPVYLGICHFDSYDMFNMRLESIEVTHNGPAPAPALYAPADVKSIPANMQYITKTRK